MTDETPLLEWAFKGLVVIVGTGFGWVMNSMRENIKDIDKACEHNGRELSEFKLHVSEHYPKEITMQRLYKTIEDMARDLNEMKVMIAKKVH